MARHRGFERSTPPTHSVQCPSCDTWYVVRRHVGGLYWQLPPHVVPGLDGRLVVYASGATSPTASWCRASGHAVWITAEHRAAWRRSHLRRPTSHSTSHRGTG